MPSGYFYRFPALVLTILLVLTPFTGARAAMNPLYTVDNVQVDVTAKDAATARDTAFAQAEQLALRQLAAKFLTEDQLARFKPPDDLAVSTMIKDYETTEEHLSNVRYVGTYSFRFKSDYVRSYLSSLGLNYSETVSRPLLILPFYSDGKRTILWGDDNPWLAAWGSSTPATGLVPLMVPIGDAQDLSDIGDNDAMTYSHDNIQDMLHRYSAGDAALAIATAVSKKDKAGALPSEVDVKLYRTDRSPPELVSTVKIPAHDGDDARALYGRAVMAVRGVLQHGWKNHAVAAAVPPVAAPQTEEPARAALSVANAPYTTPEIAASAGMPVQAHVHFVSIAEWLGAQKTLRRIPGVANIRLHALKPDSASISFTYEGTEDRLLTALSQARLTPTAMAPSYDSAGNGKVYDLQVENSAPGAY